jgi:hypothetical protein
VAWEVLRGLWGEGISVVEVEGNLDGGDVAMARAFWNRLGRPVERVADYKSNTRKNDVQFQQFYIPSLN